ncbi:hypothetical protein GLI01_27870 [Gluconacetobacter liquefaciens]|nr:hypothetical protein GLI01_27870 [Gluconacetobacter liquefaciens]
MMAADITVERQRLPLAGGCIFEDFEIRPVLAAKEAEFAHDGAGRNVEMDRQPVIVRLERAQRIDMLAADDIDEKAGSFFDVGHGEADMLHTAQSG